MKMILFIIKLLKDTFFLFTNGKLCHQFESLKPIVTVTSKPKWLAFRKLAIKYIWGHAK